MQQTARQQPRFQLPLFFLMAIFAAFLLWFAITRSYTQLAELTSVEATTQAILEDESAAQVDLISTKAYVDSVQRLKDYQQGEANRQQPGEIVIKIKVTEVAQTADNNNVVPDPAIYARPWQMWWHLLTDAPAPKAP